MASKNKTQKLELNLWESTDRPQRADFNSDNLIIDEVLGAHIEDTECHLTSTEKSRVKKPVQVFGYQGNSNAEATLTFDSVPTGVIVYCDSAPVSYYDASAGCSKVYSAVVFYGAGGSSGAELSGKVLKVRQDSAPANGVMNCLNESGKQYKVIVIK